MKTWIKNHLIQAMLGSGCAQSLVRADLSTPQRNCKAGPVRMACHHGEIKQIECQWIWLQVMEHQGMLLVGVVP